MTMSHTMKEATRSTLAAIWNMRPESAGNRIIYYHSVHPSQDLSITPANFKSHIRTAKELGYRFITHKQIPSEIDRAKHQHQEPWLAIGFDDGYEDNFEYACPVLNDEGVSATFFVVAGQVGQSNEYPANGYQLYPARRMLSTKQLRSMALSGHEVASHGLQHELATAVLEGKRDLAKEYRVSRDLLSEWSGEDVVSYSYPNGQRGAFSSDTRKATKAAGFQSASVTTWGRVDAGTDPFLLPRCEIAAEDSAATLRAKLTGKLDYLHFAHRVRRSPTWVA